VLRALILAVGLTALPAAAAAEPLTFRIPQTVSVDGVDQTLVIAATLGRRAEDGRLPITLTSDLADVQARLPGQLSGVLEQSCSKTIRLNVRSVRAEGRYIRVRGTVNGKFRACTRVFGQWVKTDIASQSAKLNALFDGRLRDRCLALKTHAFDAELTGLLGEVVKAGGLSQHINRLVQARLDAELKRKSECFEMPPELEALDARIDRGRFVDLGGGRLGAEVAGSIKTDWANILALLATLRETGAVTD